MKKFFTLLFILVAFVSFSQAQIQIGPKVGLNIASIAGSDATDYFGESLDSRTGFNGGIFFMYQFNKMFAIQPEVYYTMKGASKKIEGVDVSVKLDYVEVPLFLKFVIPVEGSNVRPVIFAGPALGFNMSAKVKGESGEGSAEVDIKDYVKSTDFSLIFGGGVGFMVGTNELGADVRYILGLTTWDDEADPLDVKNNVINFNVYFGFSLH